MPYAALGALAAGAISGISQSIANSKNVAMQNKWNEKMLDFSKNAQSIAASDRMRAGLSPLDTQAAETPALTSPEYQSLGDFGLNNAVTAMQTSQRLKQENVGIMANANLANSQALKENAETANILRQFEDEMAVRSARRDALEAEYNAIRDKGSLEAKQIKKQLDVMETSMSRMNVEMDNLRSQTSSNLYNLNWFRSVNLPSSTGFNFSNLYATGIWTGKGLSDSNNSKEENDYHKIEQERAQKYIEEQSRIEYEKWLRDYDARKKNLDTQVYKGILTRDQAKEQLGKRLSYSQWKRDYGF